MRALSPLGFVILFLMAPTLSACDSSSEGEKSPLAPICIDGLFDDWSRVPVAIRDATGDGQPGGVDLGRIWLAHDHQYLFLRFETGREIDLNESNDLRFYLDTDANSATGHQIGGIGAEVEWRPGERQGTYYVGESPIEIDHRALHFIAEPTVTSSVFEVAIGRDARPDGEHPLFVGSTFHLLIRDGTGGDQAPEQEILLSHTFDPDEVLEVEPIPLERPDPEALRLVTYNVLFDSPWAEGQEARFGRQLAAVRPDVVAFQEIWEHHPAEAASLLSRWAAGHYFAEGSGDCIIVSRYRILGTASRNGNLAALLDTSDILGKDLLVINAHLPCCADEQGRQAEADNIVSFLRDSRLPGADLEIPSGTPFVIMGDLNLVGTARPLETLLTGDIVYEDRFGEDIDLDWDGSELANLISRQTEQRLGYTWRGDGGAFWPGHLDYIIYTDSALEVAHHFLLYTPEMSTEALDAYGLEREDSLASDHLLSCADLRASR